MITSSRGIRIYYFDLLGSILIPDSGQIGADQGQDHAKGHRLSHPVHQESPNATLS